LLSGLRIFRRWRGRQGNRCLYPAADGETYLYVEQQKGARLAVFDVTDPAKIKTAASVAVKTPGAFDFVCLLNDQAELIRFRDNLLNLA
jgi:hypothetical protein